MLKPAHCCSSGTPTEVRFWSDCCHSPNRVGEAALRQPHRLASAVKQGKNEREDHAQTHRRINRDRNLDRELRLHGLYPSDHGPVDPDGSTVRPPGRWISRHLTGFCRPALRVRETRRAAPRSSSLALGLPHSGPRGRSGACPPEPTSWAVRAGDCRADERPIS